MGKNKIGNLHFYDVDDMYTRNIENNGPTAAMPLSQFSDAEYSSITKLLFIY